MTTEKFIWRLVLFADSKWKRFKNSWHRNAAAPSGGNSVKLESFKTCWLKCDHHLRRKKLEHTWFFQTVLHLFSCTEPKLTQVGHLREDYDASTCHELQCMKRDQVSPRCEEQKPWNIHSTVRLSDRRPNRNNSINLQFSPDDDDDEKERERSSTNMSSRLTFVFAVFTFWIVKKETSLQKNAQTKTAFINTMRGIRYKQLCNKK